MIFRLRIILAVSVILSALVTASIRQVQAKSVADSMGDFWEDVGGAYSNATDAGGYQLQGAGYYTGGSFTARTKVVNVNPVSIAPPSMRAGCGGIDVYTGAFSHINTDQFIALLKAIPSNAIGFAFQLALETMSPAVKGTMDQLHSLINTVNNANLNSCEIAQQAVVGLGSSNTVKSWYCATSANSKGSATDYARSKLECGTGGKATEHTNAADKDNGSKRLHDINIAWEVLKESQLLADNQDELAQFVQALTGTIIIKAPANDDASAEIIYKPNTIIKSETLKGVLEGGKVTILACDERDKCLNPVEKTITIPEDKGFKEKIADLMVEMVTRIATGQKFDQKHIDLVNKTSIPVHKAMVVRQAYLGSSSAASGINPEYYSALVSIDMLYNYLDEILRSVQEQTKLIKNFDQENVEKFQKGVEAARKELAGYKIGNKDSFKQGLELIQDTQRIESMLAARMGNRMKANLLWASKL